VAKRIYVVEDDENICELVKMALQSFSYEAETFGDAESALRAVAANAPDLIIFDIMLPGISGLEAMKRLREEPKTSSLPIILLTAKGSEVDRVSGLDSGADDYIVKPFSVMELGARVRAIFRRTKSDAAAPGSAADSAGSVFSFPGLTINLATREAIKDGSDIGLSFKEFEILRILMQENARVVSREELLKEVWGDGSKEQKKSHSLGMHIKTLRAKLGDNAEDPKYIKTVTGVGYRFIAGDASAAAGANGEEEK
jgi:two-component system alkaline phosphatase synthesis response regulator PhoP